MLRKTDRRDREGGQIVILFALSLVAILAMGGLLFSGAQALVLRRQLQNAGDAAALAAANPLIIEGGCSASGPGGAPRATIVTAAKTTVTNNIPGYDPNNVAVSCPVGPITVTNPSGYGNYAVQVDLSGTAPSYFGAINLNPKTSSTAFNGEDRASNYSVALLDPSRCGSFSVNGGITVTLEGSMFVSSTCLAAAGGDADAHNSAFQMNLVSPAVVRLAGEMSSGTAGKINPPPIERFLPIPPDPLSGLVKPCHASPEVPAASCVGSTASLPARNTNKTGPSAQCAAPNDNPCVILPGTYSGGILAANGSGASTLLLRPGIYYIEGGGLELKSAAGRIIAIPSASGSCGGLLCTDAQARSRYALAVTDANTSVNWEADCPLPTSPPPPAVGVPSPCGVMIYNAKQDSKTTWQTTGQADQIKNGAQGVLLLRSYNPLIDALGLGVTYATYKNMVLWQARTPAPPAFPQPVVLMRGGACLMLTGTVYVPGGDVDWGGGSCGTGGGPAIATLQFVVRNLTLSGNSSTTFHYQDNAFATPFIYGLIK